MIDNTSPVSAAEEPALFPNTDGSEFELPSYDIAPEDADLAREIENFSWSDVPSPVEVKGNLPQFLNQPLTLAAVPSAAREAIQAQLEGVPAAVRSQREHELVLAYAAEQSKLYKERMAAGANEFQRECSRIAREQREAFRRIDALQAELNDVMGWEPVENPETGETEAKAVHRYQGDVRRVKEAELREQMHRLHLLQGVEGQRRLEKARYEAVQAEKAKREELAVHQEAKKRAEEILHEKRVEKLAKSYARLADNGADF